MPPIFETVALFTPHGWALRGWKLALAGGGAGDVLLPVICFLTPRSVPTRKSASRTFCCVSSIS
jgi:hypothetical protein